MTHWDYSNPLLLYCTRTESVLYSCGGCCPLPRPNPPLCNTQCQLVSFQSLKISIDNWALGYNKAWHPLLIWNTLLTNWNSVAAPAPASAFLSAPVPASAFLSAPAKRTKYDHQTSKELGNFHSDYHVLQRRLATMANIGIGPMFPYWRMLIEHKTGDLGTHVVQQNVCSCLGLLLHG